MTSPGANLSRLVLALQNKPRMSNKNILHILTECVGNLDEDIDNHARLMSEDMGRPLVNLDWRYADDILDANQELGITTFSFADQHYPMFLKAVKNPPALLHVRGNANVLADLPGVAVVGTREVTKNGAEIARRLGRFLGEQGWVVVSGLAIGVDAAAHEGTLNGGGRTIAVLASGLDNPSPKKNELLAYDILDNDGAWMSEQPIGEPARRQNFVPRNRIQVGLSAGSIIVEAEERSGSISQANFCIEIGRPLFAVMPEDEENSLGLRSSGTEFLVRERGAIPIRSRSDYGELQEVLDKSKLRIRDCQL